MRVTGCRAVPHVRPRVSRQRRPFLRNHDAAARPGDLRRRIRRRTRRAHGLDARVRVTVVDVRDAFLTPDRFPGATLMSRISVSSPTT